MLVVIRSSFEFPQIVISLFIFKKISRQLEFGNIPSRTFANNCILLSYLPSLAGEKNASFIYAKVLPFANSFDINNLELSVSPASK